MSGIKISALPAIGTPALTDLYATVQAGVTYKISGTQLTTLFVAIAGGTMTGPLFLSGLPTSPTEAASKAYVDSVAQGITIQGACVVATTGALTATYFNGAGNDGIGATLTNAGAFAALSIDGVSLAVGNRVLVKDQAAPAQNGIYTVTIVGDGVSINWVMTRATDYNTPAQINKGDLVIIESGTINTKSSWIETAVVATIGTDAITFSQFTAALPIPVPSGGTGLTTTTINQILWSPSANTIAGLATAASGVLVTSAGGVPSISSTLPAFTTSSITFSPTTGGIVGTTTNDSAAAGKVGEYKETIVLSGAAVALTTNVAKTITTLALTAGDWDVFGFVSFLPGAGTTTQNVFGSISLVNNTMATAGNASYFGIEQLNLGADANSTFPLNTSRISLAAPTTIYLIGLAAFSVSTLSGYGFVGARRAR